MPKDIIPCWGQNWVCTKHNSLTLYSEWVSPAVREGRMHCKLHSQAASSSCWCHSLSQLIYPHNQPARYMHKMKDGYESLWLRNKLASYMQNKSFFNWNSLPLLEASQKAVHSAESFLSWNMQNQICILLIEHFNYLLSSLISALLDLYLAKQLTKSVIWLNLPCTEM